jgi:CRISPR/Cas system CSM-associated protein Csm4 (group 5 of RAMP superfamily)
MSNLIAIIILLVGFFGMGIIFFWKIPVLIELPQESVFQETLILKLKKKIKNISFIKSFSFEKFLQIILSKIRISALIIEKKTGIHLQNLREKAKKEKEKENDNYWEEIKKIKNGKQ